MIIRTRVFDFADNRYENLSDLAKAMGISVSQVYRVREGKRGINEKFLIGAKAAFPDLRLDELFYFNTDNKSGKSTKKTKNQRAGYTTKRRNGGNGKKQLSD